MGAPKITNKPEVERWMRNGLSNAEILQRMADKYNLAGDDLPSTQALSMFRSRHSVPRQKFRHADLVPWEIALEHRGLWPAKMLRAEGRVRRGAELEPTVQRWLDNWKLRLESGDLAGRVVHYEPEVGFVYVPRRDGIDTDLIRDPNEPDPGE